MSEPTDSDRLEDTPHPRETMRLIGHGDAERTLLDAFRSGRMPHAVILGGPEGIGKATLAYRAARFILAHPDPATAAMAETLAVDPASAVARQVAAQAHLDLLVIRRGFNERTKKATTEIPADEVRRIIGFFGTTAGSGGWRIAIVDAADDLNATGANALLKILEEPPPRSLFLIVSHRPGRLLPTIRSRCRRLILSPLGEADAVTAAAAACPDLGRSDLANAAALAQGSVRRTIQLAAGEGVALHQAMTALFARLPALDIGAAHAFADRFAARGGEEAFALFQDFLEDWLSQRLRAEAGAPVARLARWAEVWDRVREAVRDVDVFNLDRKPFILSLLSMLAAASRP